VSKKKPSAFDKIEAMYAKNSRVMQILDNSTLDIRDYTEDMGVPLTEENALRKLTGLPCIPFNKIIQVAGKPDTGKSTIGTDTAVSAQKAGFKILLWDTEDKFDPARFQKFGGVAADIKSIKTNEIAIGGQLVKDYIKAFKTDEPKCKIFIIWDSIGGGVSRTNAEINRITKRNAQPGQEAKENGQVVKDIVTMMNVYPDSICMYMANQTYAKIGFMQKGDKAKGGDGVEFFSSIIVFMKRMKVLTAVIGKKMMKKGIITEATVTKNHLSREEDSVYKMKFEVTASGIKESDFEFKKKDEEDESEEDTE
jgi:RecA/RadA recombinase